jgi:hypothetical protein
MAKAVVDFKVHAEEPPAPARRGGSKFDAILESLKKTAGKWYCINEYTSKVSAYGMAAQLRKNYKGFEFRGAQTEKGSKLYAKFVK